VVARVKSKNFEAEDRCKEIRYRAERKWGQLYKVGEKAKGSPGNQYTGPVEHEDRSKTLADLGISKGTAQSPSFPLRRYGVSENKQVPPCRYACKREARYSYASCAVAVEITMI
jgi:hypothetical protein